MVRGQVGVVVFDAFGRGGLPEPQADHCGQPGQYPQEDQCGGHRCQFGDPAGQGVGDEPAGVAERELGGEDGGAVFGVGRAAQEAA